MVFAEIHRKPGNVDDFPVFINKYGPNLADSRRHFPHRIGFAAVLEIAMGHVAILGQGRADRQRIICFGDATIFRAHREIEVELLRR